MNEQHWLRINGTITSDIPYQPGHGFETPVIPRCFPKESDPGAPQGYTLTITDLQGKQFWEGIPVIDGGSNDVPGRWDLSGYIPLLVAPGFYEVRRYNQSIYRIAIPENPPVIKITHWKPGHKHASIAWEAYGGGVEKEGKSKLLFTAACIVAAKTFPLLFKSTATTVEVDLTKIPGAAEARIVVRASDGVRSSVATTEPFGIPAKPPVLRITQPAAGSVFSAIEPIPVAGIARDAAGFNLAFDRLRWSVEPDDDTLPFDNNTTGAIRTSELLQNQHGQLVLTNLPAGKHRIRLSYPGSVETVETSIHITVRPMDEWEREWKEIFGA